VLTSDLLRVRFRKGKIYPPYINEKEQEHLEMAETLIRLFTEHQGATRQELNEALKDTTGSGTDYLFHRGLGKLLTDRCSFETSSSIDPVVLRSRIFEGAAAA